MKRPLIGLFIGAAITILTFMVWGLYANETSLPSGHVSVRILIESSVEITEIRLNSEQSEQVVFPQNHEESLIVFPCSGEGTFRICCTFSDQRQVCSKEQYVESGYSPILKISGTEILVVESL